MSSYPIKIFISYAHEGPPVAIEETVRILNHLNKRNNNYKLKFWYDKHIELGIDYDPQILEHLKEADIVLLLITREFFRSEYIIDLSFYDNQLVI